VKSTIEGGLARVTTAARLGLEGRRDVRRDTGQREAGWERSDGVREHRARQHMLVGQDFVFMGGDERRQRAWSPLSRRGL
jgi:hypothetical protein